MKRFDFACFFAAAFAVSATAALAQSRTADMREAWSGIPHTAMYLDGASGVHIGFHSPAAARTVGIGYGDRRASPGVVSLAVTGPSQMSQYLFGDEAAGWPERLGFAPFNVMFMASIDAPPVRAYTMRLTPHATTSAEAALQSTGYEAVTAAGGSYFARGGGDFELDIMNRDPLDPFGGHLGQASRVAIDGDVLVYSSSSRVLSNIMWGQGASLTDHPEITRLLAAVDAMQIGNAQVLQAMLLSDPTVFRPRPVSSGLAVELPEVPALGPWIMGMMLEASDGATNSGIIALSFVTEEAAAAAAAALPATLEGYVSLARRTPILESLPAAPVIEVSTVEPRVVLVQVSSPRDTEESDLMSRTNFDLLRNFLYNGDLVFLAPF